MITLYSYFRSSTAYRVRIALHLKGLDFKTVPVNLLKGEQNEDAYRTLNPIGGVPALTHDGFTVAQSLAIINYIDNIAPEPPLSFGSAADQAFVRQVALTIATDIHPLINIKVLKYLEADFGAGDAEKNKWVVHWHMKGMAAVEALLRNYGRSGDFAMGDRASVADVCIIPQMYSLRRFGVKLDDYPICRRIESHCVRLPAFQSAAPETQPDAPSDLVPIHGPHAPLLKEKQV